MKAMRLPPLMNAGSDSLLSPPLSTFRPVPSMEMVRMDETLRLAAMSGVVTV